MRWVAKVARGSGSGLLTGTLGMAEMADGSGPSSPARQPGGQVLQQVVTPKLCNMDPTVLSVLYGTYAGQVTPHIRR